MDDAASRETSTSFSRASTLPLLVAMQGALGRRNDDAVTPFSLLLAIAEEINRIRERHSTAKQAARNAALNARINEMLGNRCAACGNDQGPFERDHIDPSTKRYSTPRLSWRARLYRYLDEAKRGELQLLCVECHREKPKGVAVRYGGGESISNEPF